MRAVALESVPSDPAVTEVDTPRPGVGELLVKVAAASLNGIDIATAAGYTQAFMEHRFPLVLGQDFAGTVEALGEGVDGLAVGDAVFGLVLKPYLGAGSLAQYVTVPAGHGVARIPAGVTAEDAGALGVAGLTAVVCLDAVALAEGETVLISGAGGGVGALAVQLAAARGAKVIATARPGAQTDFVTGLTGTEIHVVDFTADLEGQVRAITPEGVDTVLHLAGDGPALAALLRPGGQLASATGLSQDDVKGHDVTVHTIMAAPGPKTLTSLAEQVASGALRVPVTATYPLERATEAFAAFGAGTPGKITVSCS
ncbi:NADP-dependent oxidoreductase [Streptomyces caniscabiei]|uniref:NADP-dependent oxidoreductase n=1 Tax=Streptomyces caniscabiei TaxID=2746961 RepID=A0A927L8A1_9ACTN|nr:NADP-dependent oxidoreductase [Streptomyces caniscabiei]MBD9727330.1 NADP-dependent oxidoreductase [Streptomyces caniscabiei]MDX3512791.1 NADP-dependent oxidoreductase [Streptomyces caniscabiei]MDX3722316.1 NADP-dependent oxidoreductase [Streptomyces caniscabiei]WEO28708.1 NADP-dependent oxidoreductase [Streptomyces caniscabiei]